MLLKLVGMGGIDLDAVNALHPSDLVFSNTAGAGGIGQHLIRLLPDPLSNSISRSDLLSLSIAATDFSQSEDLYLITSLMQVSRDFRFYTFHNPEVVILTGLLSSYLALLNLPKTHTLNPVAERVLNLLQTVGFQTLFSRLFREKLLNRNPRS